MNDLPTLKAALLDLLYETRAADLKLIIGGGYGIFLKREYVKEHSPRTVLEQWPQARSTKDIDLFLRPELLIYPAQLKPLGSAFERLGYKVVPTAPKFQFAKPGPKGDREGSVKFDLLTGPPSHFKDTPAKVDSRRVSPEPSVDVHARHVEEAVTLEEGLLPIRIAGATMAGAEHAADVYLPHPFTFAMMKLFAYRDFVTGKKARRDDARMNASHHALDLYTVIAMASEPEWNQALELRARFAGEIAVIEAGHIVRDNFSTKSSVGMLRLRDSAYYRPELQLDGFLSALHELFGVE